MENNNIDEKMENLAKEFSNNLQQDPSIISQLATAALQNNNEKMENVSNSFNTNKEVKNEVTSEEIQLYKNILVQPVESSNIEGISYLAESKILKVRDRKSVV